MSDHYDRYNGMENLLGTDLAEVGADCISRQQAIDALERAKQNIHHNIERAIGDAICEVLDTVESGIKQLPPIQHVNNSEVPNSSDCISRQAATDALRKMQTYKMFSGDDMLLIDQAGAMTELMLLPPAEPERLKGEWEIKKSTIHPYGNDVCCPMCGADMRGEQDG